MLTYPNIDPVAFTIGGFSVYWYGLMYLSGFFVAWVLAQYRAKRIAFTRDHITDLIFYCSLGVILGGRLGYGIFYQPSEFFNNPFWIFQVQKGGMSFHGGLLGVIGAMFLFAKRHKTSFWIVADFIAPLIPIGLGLGRIGNFINGELWGKTTDFFLGMVFPNAGNLPRHPSMLYEAFFEGLVLFFILWFYSAKNRKAGTVAGLFLIGYAIIRIGIEFVRVPDEHLGYLAFGWLTQGQLLSIPMILFGLYLFMRKNKGEKALSASNNFENRQNKSNQSSQLKKNAMKSKAKNDDKKDRQARDKNSNKSKKTK